MKKELGKWILDVAKYLTTAGLIAPFLTKVDSWTGWIIASEILVIATMLSIGLYLTKEEVTKKHKK